MQRRTPKRTNEKGMEGIIVKKENQKVRAKEKRWEKEKTTRTNQKENRKEENQKERTEQGKGKQGIRGNEENQKEIIE